MHVARIARVPHRRDADLGLVHVLLAHTRGVQHGLRGALRLGLGNVPADRIEFIVRFGGAECGAGEGTSGAVSLGGGAMITGEKHTLHAIAAAASTLRAREDLRSVRETLWLAIHVLRMSRQRFINASSEGGERGVGRLSVGAADQ